MKYRLETQVRAVLADYKAALIFASYRNWRHQMMNFLGDRRAMLAEAALVDAENRARSIINSTKEHQAVCRMISAQQPEHARHTDNFLMLIEETN